MNIHNWICLLIPLERSSKSCLFKPAKDQQKIPLKIDQNQTFIVAENKHSARANICPKIILDFLTFNNNSDNLAKSSLRHSSQQISIFFTICANKSKLNIANSISILINRNAF
jgi:hypothetical protein